MRKCGELKGQVLVEALYQGKAFIDKDMKTHWNKCYECETELTVTFPKCNYTSSSVREEAVKEAHEIADQLEEHTKLKYIGGRNYHFVPLYLIYETSLAIRALSVLAKERMSTQ